MGRCDPTVLPSLVLFKALSSWVVGSYCVAALPRFILASSGGIRVVLPERQFLFWLVFQPPCGIGPRRIRVQRRAPQNLSPRPQPEILLAGMMGTPCHRNRRDDLP